ncbi:hypothetical protein MPTK1_4g17840 [Marchantia polymorpha subsp. ruderalis]|uniref:Uncharacterized protein n=2 Tax=Marchantia polymorpha TaxID=3197 RepID=A0AAF6BAZ8_MARPO|nr:hypothetical protein MARPO_0041s0065 [Marchantia polymorpha]BBN09182.1 hypothetical protein Mp_4g17840 [Marchantia polymorpha subsp. ruderalis]|eukprot:PTQ40170.1 hypothetical protein MARPO_0041s0065 [Marchantia polymorpha]
MHFLTLVHIMVLNNVRYICKKCGIQRLKIKISHYLGPNNRLLNQSALLSRFDIDEISRGDGGLDAIGISFDQLDLQSCTVEYTVFYQPSHIHELPTVVAFLDNSLLHFLRLNRPD